MKYFLLLFLFFGSVAKGSTNLEIYRLSCRAHVLMVIASDPETTSSRKENKELAEIGCSSSEKTIRPIDWKLGADKLGCAHGVHIGVSLVSNSPNLKALLEGYCLK